MTQPTKSVRVRRLSYANAHQPMDVVYYDDPLDSRGEYDVLDVVLKYLPYPAINITNGTWHIEGFWEHEIQ